MKTKSGESFSKMTVKQLFNAVKSSPMEVIFSFSETGRRYYLASVTVGCLDPIIQKVRGAIICCHDTKKVPLTASYHFKFESAKIFIWAFLKPQTPKNGKKI